MRPKLRIAGVCLAVAVALFTSGRVASAGPQQGDMKTSHEGMMMRMGELDARIATLTAQMNTSAGEAKITAMAALLNAIVEQHKTMRSAMMMMMHMSRGHAAPEASVEPEESEEMCAMEKPAPATTPSHVHPAN